MILHKPKPTFLMIPIFVLDRLLAEIAILCVKASFYLRAIWWKEKEEKENA